LFCQKWILILRDKLLKSGILTQKDDVLVFNKDYTFKSPTGAAVVMLGSSANGWIAWKYKNGKTLDEVKRK
jgi:Domain of unknown function (DUF4357)